MKSFVVRIRQDASGTESLRGVVDDVSTGQRSMFHAGQELLDVLAAGVGATSAGESDEGPEHREKGESSCDNVQ